MAERSPIAAPAHLAGLINIATNATISAGGGTLNLTGGILKNGTTLTFQGGGTSQRHEKRN